LIKEAALGCFFSVFVEIPGAGYGKRKFGSVRAKRRGLITMFTSCSMYRSFELKQLLMERVLKNVKTVLNIVINFI
jgi:hypothetical protein